MACSTAPVSMATLCVLPQIAVVAVDGDEELGPDQVDQQAHLFLAAVAADVDQSMLPVVVDHVGVAAARGGR